MAEERRGAERVRIPVGVETTVSGVAVRLLELSAIGARIEHEERFSLNAPQLRIAWGGTSVTLPVQIARAEIAGRRGSRLVYQSGIRFTAVDAEVESVIGSILGWAEASPPAVPEVLPEAVATAASATPERPIAPPQPHAAAPAANRPSLDDSWTRQVRFFKEDLEEDQLPYAQFRLTATGWEKNYVASPEQPEDGFTIARGALDFAELQKSFEYADPDTRRMMQIALESKLAASRS